LPIEAAARGEVVLMAGLLVDTGGMRTGQGAPNYQ
jgi:hypothetical protein